jgi:multicomponent K+:H+ antiporter subunit C
MNLLLVTGIGILVGCGLWLMLRPRTFELVLGLALLGYGVNLFIFAMGRATAGAAPFVGKGMAPAALARLADPLPQALVLTAIVIGFAMTALLLAIALRARYETGSDHVDGEEPADG